jgi:phospholipid/cholesterol/gamma-HCH transport system permease protein
LSSHLAARRDDDRLELDLTGDWRIAFFPQLESQLSALELSGVREVHISTRGVSVLDLSAAWRLREFIHRAQESGATVTFEGESPDQLRLIDEALAGNPVPEPPVVTQSLNDSAIEPVRALGRETVRRWRDTLEGLAFIGQLSTTAAAAALSFKRLRPISVARHIYDTGITAIPIVTLIAFLISVIIAYMSAQQLQRFGAEIFVVDLVTIGVLRELAVLLTAIIVAGRSGSAFAAEIGAMKLNEEVDALKAIGVSPFEVLVTPRVLGLVIALPLLTMIADIVGLLGGALLCRFLLDMPLTQFFERADDAISSTTFWVGIVKAPVFAMLIAISGTYRGMQVRGSSRELGRLTTVAVVQSIFLVILADAIFAVIFMELDI